MKDPSKQFAQQTGGEQFYFVKQKGLEDAVQRISQEIRSQYLISYRPNNAGEAGYHTIAVSIDRIAPTIAKPAPVTGIGGGAVAIDHIRHANSLETSRWFESRRRRTHRSREMTPAAPKKAASERLRELWPDIWALVRPRRKLLSARLCC